ncbi:MAG: hypothetical protein ACR2FG_07955 [Marmoricola sp.]
MRATEAVAAAGREAQRQVEEWRWLTGERLSVYRELDVAVRRRQGLPTSIGLIHASNLHEHLPEIYTFQSSISFAAMLASPTNSDLLNQLLTASSEEVTTYLSLTATVNAGPRQAEAHRVAMLAFIQLYSLCQKAMRRDLVPSLPDQQTPEGKSFSSVHIA